MEQRVAPVPVAPDAAVRGDALAAGIGRTRTSSSRRRCSSAWAGAGHEGTGASTGAAGRTGSGRWRRRVAEADEASESFTGRRSPQAGGRSLAMLERSGRTGIVLAGPAVQYPRPGVNLSMASKLREYLRRQLHSAGLAGDRPRTSISATSTTTCTGTSAARFLAAPAVVSRQANLHMIYITNFKCGPDSYIKHFVRAGVWQAVPDPAVRRPQQRRRHDDPLRGVPRQQRHPPAVEAGRAAVHHGGCGADGVGC